MLNYKFLSGTKYYPKIQLIVWPRLLNRNITKRKKANRVYHKNSTYLDNLSFLPTTMNKRLYLNVQIVGI